MSCNIEIDHRQIRGGVPELLREVQKLPVVIKNNATPDYIWNTGQRQYWVEQKTWDDWFDSCNGVEVVNDKKVMKVVRQLWTAIRSGADTTLLLEGIPWVNNDGSIRDRRWKESSVDAILLRISMRGVRPLFSKDPEKSALTIATLYHITHEVGTVWPADALPFTPIPALPVPWIKNVR